VCVCVISLMFFHNDFLSSTIDLSSPVEFKAYLDRGCTCL